MTKALQIDLRVYWPNPDKPITIWHRIRAHCVSVPYELVPLVKEFISWDKSKPIGDEGS